MSNITQPNHSGPYEKSKFSKLCSLNVHYYDNYFIIYDLKISVLSIMIDSLII